MNWSKNLKNATKRVIYISSKSYQRNRKPLKKNSFFLNFQSKDSRLYRVSTKINTSLSMIYFVFKDVLMLSDIQ